MSIQERRLDEAAEFLLDEDEVYEKNATPLISARELRNQHKERVKNYLRDNELKRSILRGLDLIRRDIIEVLNIQELGEFYSQFGKINPNALDDPDEKLQQKMEEKGEFLTFQDVFDLPDEILTQIYTLGYQYFNRKEFENARDIFSLVSTLNPFVTDYWNALAATYQALREWEKAKDTFTVACTLNEEDLAGHIGRAYCCVVMHRRKEARHDYEIAKEIMQNNPALDAEWGTYLKQLREQVA